jgi:REP element-mobilizing transposase RayT
MEGELEPQRPTRKALPHDIPIWIDPAAEVYFITINARQRNQNSLCHDNVSQSVFDSVAHRNGAREWHCHLCLLMPDHLHALISFTCRSKDIAQTIGDWKRWLHRTASIDWQPQYFEHRLRGDREHLDKAAYILQNPVRKGLVSKWQDWPYLWRPITADER